MHPVRSDSHDTKQAPSLRAVHVSPEVWERGRALAEQLNASYRAIDPTWRSASDIDAECALLIALLEGLERMEEPERQGAREVSQ